MSTFLRGLNRALRRLRRICKFVLVVCAVVLSALVVAGIIMESNKAQWQGIAAIRPVLDRTGEQNWPAAFAFVVVSVGAGVLAALVMLMVAQAILRRILLLHSEPGIAEVVRPRQTGASVNQRPLMTIWMRVAGASGSHIVTVNKLIDLGNMPRPGDRARVAVSRIDPSCVDFLGLIQHPR